MQHTIDGRPFMIMVYEKTKGELTAHAGPDELSIMRDVVSCSANFSSGKLRHMLDTLRHATTEEIDLINPKHLGAFLSSLLCRHGDSTYLLGFLKEHHDPGD